MIDLSAAKGGALFSQQSQFNWITPPLAGGKPFMRGTTAPPTGGKPFMEGTTTAKHTSKLYTNKAFQSLAFRGRAPSIFSRPTAHTPPRLQLAPQAHKTYGAIILAPAEDGQIKYALVQGRYTGKWSFPKGHANEEEAPLACTKREVTEEIGLETLPEPIEYIQVGYGNYHVFHLPAPVSLDPRDTNEIMDTRWVTLDEMRQLPLNADASMFTRRQ
jgi:8-oxo-dGTP pyrophosphatase MutT (NUDIX family)